MSFVYMVNYEKLDWDTQPLHILGIFSNKHEAFKTLKRLIRSKWKELGDEDIFADIKIRKSSDRVYVDLEGDEFIDEWRFRVIRFKLNEVLKDELITGNKR